MSKWRFLRRKLRGGLDSGSNFQKRNSQGELDQEEDDRVVLTSVHRNSIDENHCGPEDHFDDYCFDLLKEKAEQLLDSLDYNLLLNYVKIYHESKNIDDLVKHVFQTLDTPEKILLLRDIRAVIYNRDIIRFDLRVSQFEISAYENHSTKLNLPLRRADDNRHGRTKPKKLVTEITQDGHFSIKSEDQFEKENRIKMDVIEKMKISTSESTTRDVRTPILDVKNNMHQADELFQKSKPKSVNWDTEADRVITYVSKEHDNLGWDDFGVS